MKITESILIETNPFDPSNLAETLSEVADLIHLSEAASYTVVKSSIKADLPKWQIAVLMRRPSATKDEWNLTLEALSHESPF